jgi:transcriptional regulator with PAS, ATPase and Fis domain
MNGSQAAAFQMREEAANVSVTEVIFQPGTKLEEVEKEVILATLKRTHAARVLGIGIRTLQRKLKKYGAEGLGLKRALMNA